MNKYRVVLLDFNKPGKFKEVWTRYTEGLSQARQLAPMPISYCHNAKCFTGWSENLNCVVTKI